MPNVVGSLVPFTLPMVSETLNLKRADELMNAQVMGTSVKLSVVSEEHVVQYGPGNRVEEHVPAREGRLLRPGKTPRLPDR